MTFHSERQAMPWWSHEAALGQPTLVPWRNPSLLTLDMAFAIMLYPYVSNVGEPIVPKATPQKIDNGSMVHAGYHPPSPPLPRPLQGKRPNIPTLHVKLTVISCGRDEPWPVGKETRNKSTARD